MLVLPERGKMTEETVEKPFGGEQDIPQWFENNMGTMKLRRGSLECGMKLYAVDPVPKCRGEECPALRSGVCTYVPRGKCTFLLQYIRAVEEVLFRNFDNISEEQFFRAGTQLVSLYITLGKLQIEKAGAEQAILNLHGKLYAHPIFKEERETIREIERMWKSLGLVRDDIPDEGDITSISAHYTPKDGDTVVEVE